MDGETQECMTVANYELTFGRDEARRSVALGRVQAVVPLVCQRCLGVMEHPVDAQVCLMLLPGADPLPVVADRVSLADLVEDELLLALPQIPMHPLGTCRVAVETAAESPGSDRPASPEIAGEAQKRPNPFAALAGWKSDSKN